MRPLLDLAQRFTLISIVIALIAFLTSCASGSRPTAVAPAPEGRQQPPPPPPYVPYESHPGEAANVRKVLDDIQKKRHSDAPRPEPSSLPSSHPGTETVHGRATSTTSLSPSPYPRQPGYPATFTIINNTKCKLGFYLSGSTPREFGVEVGKSETVEITAGTYQFGVDTHLCAGDVPPLLGQDNFEAGSRYTLTLSQENIQPKMGNFVVENNTGAKLTIKVGGATHTVASGSFSIELAEGSYTAIIAARCGTVNDTFDITNGSTYTGKYWCTGSEIITRPPEVGYFDVNNNTGATLTISVGGKTYKVRLGSMTIELPEGSYTAKVSARCGSTTEKLEIESGSRHEGNYSCVSY